MLGKEIQYMCDTNIARLSRAGGAIANLQSLLGTEPDSRTVFEVPYCRCLAGHSFLRIVKMESACWRGVQRQMILQAPSDAKDVMLKAIEDFDRERYGPTDGVPTALVVKALELQPVRQLVLDEADRYARFNHAPVL
jgi:nucleoside 2-deoxyribosyltransferase